MTGRTVLRFVISATVLLGVGFLVDVPAVAARLRDFRSGWVVLALALSVLQALVLAWRWRFTARRLDIDLPFATALAEYYLGNLLNQVLPGGITGDVSRAWRHARTDVPAGAAVRTVVLERLSAQAVMTTVAALSVASIPALPTLVRAGTPALLLAVGVSLMRVAERAEDDPSAAGRFWADARRAVLCRDAWPAQLASAVFVVATYLGIYLLAARAVGSQASDLTLLPLVAPVLMTMLLPVTVAGWGLREGAAAVLWSIAGLTPEDGVAISVAYGVLTLVSTLPGLLVLTGVAGGAPYRRERRRPDGRSGPEDAAHRKGNGSAEG